MKGEKAAKPLTLEEYARFFHNPQFRRTLSHDQLNQIIYMHGFLKLHRWQKANIVETIDSMDLMRPERSTVREESQAAASDAAAAVLSLDEVKKDIQLLDWQECPLGSIVKVNAAESAISAPLPISALPAPSSPVPPPATAAAASGSTPPRASGKRKRKRKKMAALVKAALRHSLPPPVEK